MKCKNFLALVAISLLILTSMTPENTITVFMIGDSTMANKNINHGSVERGWGMVLQCYFDEGIIVDNHAVNGRSSKSFIDEGRWQKVLDKIKPGDYVFIQFGHNDEKKKEHLYTIPGSTFDDNLRLYVNQTREKGGIPVIFNSVVRRNFTPTLPDTIDDEALRNTTGVAQIVAPVEGDTLIDTHGEYIIAPRKVAEEMGVTFIDANRITHDLEQGLGPEESKRLHMWFLPGEEPSLPNGRQDNTHYNIYGAHVVASLLVDAIGEAIPELGKHVVHYDASVSRNGRGQYFNPQDAVDAVPEGGKATIQIFNGRWNKPVIPENKQITFVLRSGASWN